MTSPFSEHATLFDPLRKEALVLKMSEMWATITIADGKTDPYDVKIAHTASIGRAKDNIICLPDNPHVSRFHALLRCFDGSQYQVVDLGSRNGTYLNDERVILPTDLPPNANIRIGDIQILFTPHEGSNGLQKPMEPRREYATCVLACEWDQAEAIREAVDPVLYTQFLGKWLRMTAHEVLIRDGALNRFHSGGFTAYWTEGETRPSAAQKAFDSALEILRTTSELQNPGEPGGNAKANVGLNVGHALWASDEFEIGAPIQGEVLRVAQALADVCKESPFAMLLSDACLAALPDSYLLKLNDIGALQIKGRKTPVRTFALKSDRLG